MKLINLVIMLLLSCTYTYVCNTNIFSDKVFLLEAIGPEWRGMAPKHGYIKRANRLGRSLKSCHVSQGEPCNDLRSYRDRDWGRFGKARFGSEADIGDP